MTMDDLDQLKAANQERIRALEEKFFQKKQEQKSIKELLHEQTDARDPKERKQDSNLCYPSYGRGLDPQIPLNSYMVNPSLWREAGSPKKKNWVNKDDVATS